MLSIMLLGVTHSLVYSYNIVLYTILLYAYIILVLLIE